MVIVQNKILLLQRSGVASHGGTWAPPGGRIDPGETPIETAIRETIEEANVDMRPFYHTGKFVQPLTDEPGKYTTFVFHTPRSLTVDDFDVQIDFESTGWGWFTPEDMKLLNLHPGVIKVLEYIGVEL